MKIVQVPRRFVRSEWGGTETVVLETSKRLLKFGYDTEILCPNALADNDSEQIDGVTVRRTSYFYPYFRLSAEARGRMDKKGGNMFSTALMRELRSLPDLDLIHLHTGKRIGGIGRYVARQRRIPYLISLHGGVYDVPAEEAATWTAPTAGAIEWGRALGWWVGSNRILDDADAIVCVGKAEADAIRQRHPSRRVVHLPNGVDTARFASGDGPAFRARHGIAQAACLIGIVGRIDPQKNQEFAVQLLPEMLQIRPEAHLLLIGHVTNTTYRSQVEQEIARLGLTDRVTLLPGLAADSRDLVDAYHAMDLFLLPSIHEPFGIVILEAWAAGKPILAARVGGIPSFVEDGVNGRLFPPNDSAACLTAFRELMASPESATGLGQSGLQTVRESYDWDRITRQLADLYESVVTDYHRVAH